MFRLALCPIVVLSLAACNGKSDTGEIDTEDLPDLIDVCVLDAATGGYTLTSVEPDTTAGHVEPGEYYADSDGDGYGEGEAAECPPSESYTDSGGDAFPEDSSEWADSDSDGVGDNSDAFPEDAGESADSDGDGVGDNSDVCVGDDATGDTDGDGDCDDTDSDIDGDGVDNDGDCAPADDTVGAAGTWYADTDGDGLGDPADSTEACELPKGYVDDASDACPEADGAGASDGCPSTCGALAASVGTLSTGSESAIFTTTSGVSTDLTSTFTDGSYPSWDPTSDGTLALSAGLYQFNANISNNSGVDIVIEGAGMGSTVWEVDGSVSNPVTFYNNGDITVRDLSMTGESDYTNQYLIVFGPYDLDPVIENVEFYDWNGGAFTSFFSSSIVVSASGAYIHDLGYDTSGAAYHTSGTLVIFSGVIEDSCIEDSTSTSRGALYCQSNGSITVSGSEFSGFEATQTTSTRDGSSAINALKCSLDISDTLFEGNTTAALGGTITTECYSGYDVTLDGVTFTDNTSTSSSSTTGTLMLSDLGGTSCSSISVSCTDVSGSGNSPSDAAADNDGGSVTCDAL